MSTLAGFKSLRFMEQQLVTVLPSGQTHILPGRNYILEIEFETGGVVNVPLTEPIYRACMAFLAQQPGLTVEQRMAATEALTPGPVDAPLTGELLHRNLTPEQLASAIARVAERQKNEPKRVMRPCHRGCGAMVAVVEGTDIVTCPSCLRGPTRALDQDPLKPRT